ALVHLADVDSYPTRRSSDLHQATKRRDSSSPSPPLRKRVRAADQYQQRRLPMDIECEVADEDVAEDPKEHPEQSYKDHRQTQERSEEHTSELQARENLVCSL